MNSLTGEGMRDIALKVADVVALSAGLKGDSKGAIGRSVTDDQTATCPLGITLDQNEEEEVEVSCKQTRCRLRVFVQQVGCLI